MAGDYLHWQFQFARKNTDLSVVAATTTQASFVAARSANHQIWVQKITVSLTTYSAKTWTFQDTAATPVVFAVISIPAAITALPSESGTITFDFGPTGTPLTAGKDLSLVISGAGAAGIVHVEGYEKLVGPVAVATTN